jgi:hypothetical protein
VLEAFEDDGIAWEKLKVHLREFERNVLPFERTSKRVRESSREFERDVQAGLLVGEVEWKEFRNQRSSDEEQSHQTRDTQITWSEGRRMSM